jgi:hypothetical protein
MVRRIDNIGLIVNLVKLNGKLELHFSSDTMFAAHYTILGTDVDDTLEIEYAREAAAGQSVVSLGLEMFVEDAQGFLDVRFEGAIGSTLAFQHDGRDLGCLLGFKETSLSGPFARLDIALDAAGSLHTPITGHVPLLGFPGIQGIPRVTRDAKVQTINQKTRNAKVQTIAPNFTHAGVQTKRKRMVNTGAQTAAATNKLHNASGPFPSTIDRFSRHEVSRAMKTLPEVAHTFTNAVATVFQTFNEPHDPYRQKRQAEPAADYRAYKHIFIEGYRNGDGKEEEGRLHVDLAHHVLLWESYDNYEGGAKLTLDRLDLPRCKSLLVFSMPGIFD